MHYLCPDFRLPQAHFCEDFAAAGREVTLGRYTKREHAAGIFWLDRRSNSPAFYICWLHGKQVRRKSTGTDDLESAKKILKAHYVAHGEPDGLDVTTVQIAEIVLRYYEQHAKLKPAAKWIKGAVAHWVRYYSDESVWSATRPNRIERFIDNLKSTGIGDSYVNSILAAGRAALNRSWKRGELSKQVYIPALKISAAKPKGRPLSPDECAAWLDAASPHFHVLLFICLATGSRPEAVKQLKWAQVDFEEGLLYLNPEGRRQTSKHRPVVKMPPTLVEYLRSLERECEWIVNYRGKPVSRYYTALGRARDRAQLDGSVNLYSPRHTIARWMRKQRVPFEELAGQLGHGVRGYAVTEIYAAYCPDYQALSTAAIERFLQAVAARSDSCKFLVSKPKKAINQKGLVL